MLAPLVIDDAAGPLALGRLVFTVRHAHLRTHAGQISFPGGKREAHDVDLASTALREAEEEIGLPRTRVEVLGLLDDVPTPSRYVITPVVGIVHGPLELAPQESEVGEIFDCTLGALAAPGVYRDGGVTQWDSVEYVMHEYVVGEHRIWGATARMVHQLLSLLGA